LAFLPFQPLFNESSSGDQLLALLPSLVHSEHPIPSPTCPFQYLVYYYYYYFLRDRGESDLELCCWFCHLSDFVLLP
jgi:hypothetical protein